MKKVARLERWKTTECILFPSFYILRRMEGFSEARARPQSVLAGIIEGFSRPAMNKDLLVAYSFLLGNTIRGTENSPLMVHLHNTTLEP
jgi:hypothetical protein